MININNILENITEKLELTDSQFNNIKTSYEAVAEWLNEGETIRKYGTVKIFPQGSVGLGTVVKPLKNDEYDVDMVVLLNNLFISEKELKQIIGLRLKENKTYKKMIDDEGKRCWKLKYSDSLSYHMDVLPTKNAIKPIVYEGIPSIIATNKDPDTGIYTAKSTNPKAYIKWFLDRTKSRKLFEAKYSIDKINEYPRKTVLQKSIQLIKRHRDVFFDRKGIDEDLPISIIITTLAAKSYQGEENLIQSLNNIANAMKNYIETDGINYYVNNPVDEEENFAEKWNENKNKAVLFFEWNNQLINDIKAINQLKSIDLANKLQDMFGEKVVKSVYESLGENIYETRINGNLRMDKESGKLNESKGEIVKQHNFYGKK